MKQTTIRLPVQPLDTRTAGAQPVRKRAQAAGKRLVVNAENPVFLLRRGYAGNLSEAEGILQTWAALPEDIRAFTVIYSDMHSGHDLSMPELLQRWDTVLDATDAAGIPMAIQVENWNSDTARDAYTPEQLDGLYRRHRSLVAMTVVELSCGGVRPEAMKRLKQVLQASADNGGLLIWQEMEYVYEANFTSRMLEDAELEAMMRRYADHIVMMDKHNGQCRHFSNQSAMLGLWLAGYCGNWGGNVENWLWWEEGLRDYDEVGAGPRSQPDLYNMKYPPALMAADMIADLVGGATVMAPEGSNQFNLYADVDGRVALCEAFWSAALPVYRQMLAGGIPTKNEVRSKIHAAYRLSDPTAEQHTRWTESPILAGLYTIDAEQAEHHAPANERPASKHWTPKTGRYYILPTLPKYASQEAVPGAVLLEERDCAAPGTQRELLERLYPAVDAGDGVLFDVAETRYSFNSEESRIRLPDQTVQFAAKNGQTVTLTLPAHTAAMYTERQGVGELTLINLRLDTRALCEGAETLNDFNRAYAGGGRMERDFRNTTVTISGAAPTVEAAGTNHAGVEAEQTAEMLRLTISSNGLVRLHLRWN